MGATWLRRCSARSRRCTATRGVGIHAKHRGHRPSDAAPRRHRARRHDVHAGELVDRGVPDARQIASRPRGSQPASGRQMLMGI